MANQDNFPRIIYDGERLICKTISIILDISALFGDLISWILGRYKICLEIDIGIVTLNLLSNAARTRGLVAFIEEMEKL